MKSQKVQSFEVEWCSQTCGINNDFPNCHSRHGSFGNHLLAGIMGIMKKTRKVNKSRVLILAFVSLLIVVLAGAGIYGGVQFVKDRNHQNELHSAIQTIKTNVDNSFSAVDSITKPEDITQETFDALKKGALSSADFSILEQYNPDERVEESYYEQVMKLPDPIEDSRYYTLLEHVNDYSEDILEYFLDNPDRYDLVAAYPQRNTMQSFTGSLTEDLSSVPLLLQWDPRWGYVPYGDSDIAVAGCAPTCLSMVLSYLLQDPTITPPAVAAYSEANGYYINGVGTAHALLSDAADHYGVKWEGVPVSSDNAKEALKDGKILILNMVPGKFTRVGHFIVGVEDEDGKILIHDPNSKERSKAWDYDEVMEETAAMWAYSK